MNSFVQKVEKPWGYELILTPSESPVAGKILHINAGCRLSYQFHEEKEESLALISGQAKIIFEGVDGDKKEIEMESQKGYWVKPYVKHRLQAVTDCEIMEVSTPEKGKTVRLEDDYARKDETEEERLKNRAI